MANCNFSGIIRLSLNNLSSLTKFDVGFNQIHGIILTNVGFTLSNHEFYSIASNQFTGPIPAWVSNCTSLQHLQLAMSKLSGTVPSLGNLHNLRWLTLSNNQLGSGGSADLDFLCSLTNSTSLTGLEIANNNFGGLLSDCISNYSSTLKVLRVFQNPISGMIPRGIGNLVNLERLQIEDNKLSGTIPDAFGNLQKLSYLGLSNNNFYGVIPSSFQI